MKLHENGEIYLLIVIYPFTIFKINLRELSPRLKTYALPDALGMLLNSMG